MKTELTIEQSDKLIELGVNPDCASITKYTPDLSDVNIIFTLTDLLELLHPVEEYGGLMIGFSVERGLWRASYDDTDFVANGSNLIDALYKLLIWTLNYKNNSEDK